jgi:hypothetical protein
MAPSQEEQMMGKRPDADAPPPRALSLHPLELAIVRGDVGMVRALLRVVVEMSSTRGGGVGGEGGEAGGAAEEEGEGQETQQEQEEEEEDDDDDEGGDDSDDDGGGGGGAAGRAGSGGGALSGAQLRYVILRAHNASVGGLTPLQLAAVCDNVEVRHRPSN